MRARMWRRDMMKSTSIDVLKSSATEHIASSIPENECCDTVPVISAREFFYGPPQCISVDCDASFGKDMKISFAEAGDEVRICILGGSDVENAISDLFQLACSEAGYADVGAVLTAVWKVHHLSRLCCADFEAQFAATMPERDRELVGRYSFVDYFSPSDSVDVEIPDIPAEEEVR